MKVKLVIITSVCIEAGKYKRVGEIDHTAFEITKRDPRPKATHTDCRDDFFGKCKELLRTEIEIDAPELDPADLNDWAIKSLKAKKKELEAEFYARTRKIDDQIASLLAIEQKP